MNDNLKQIKEKWSLPNVYLDYLAKNDKERFIEVVSDEGFSQEIRIYGKNDLIKNQEGYSFNPITKSSIDEWPENYVVIADVDADPYVIDLSNSNGEDVPVLFAYHGEGEWKFQNCAESFSVFIKDYVGLQG